MKPTFLALCLGLAACGATAGASVDSTTVAAAGATTSPTASAPVRATRAASAACAAAGASAPWLGHAVTSKVRHIPVEGDPCADSTGVAPPLPR